MDNVDRFKEILSDASQTQHIIDTEHVPVLSRLKKIYKQAFSRKGQELMVAKDILFYKGGIPNENSKSMAKKMADQIADAYYILYMLGEHEKLLSALEERGIELSVLSGHSPEDEIIPDKHWSENKKKYEKVMGLWKDVFGDDEIYFEERDLLQTLMDKALEEQRSIYNMTKEIKEVHAEKAKEECGVKPTVFKKAVKLEAKKYKGEDISDQIDEMESTAQEELETLKTIV